MSENQLPLFPAPPEGVDPLTFFLTLPIQLLNVFISLFPPPFATVASATSPSEPAIYENEETYEWYDPVLEMNRKITVHRRSRRVQ